MKSAKIVSRKPSVREFSKVVSKLSKLHDIEKKTEAAKKHANPFSLKSRQLQRNHLYFVGFEGVVSKDTTIGTVVEDALATCRGNFGGEVVMMQMRPKAHVTTVTVAGNAMVRPKDGAKLPQVIKKAVTKTAKEKKPEPVMPKPVKKLVVGMKCLTYTDKFYPGVVEKIMRKGTWASIAFNIKGAENEEWPIHMIYPAR